MPKTPLTKILHEFRAYRPLPHREFLAHIETKAKEVGVRDFAIEDRETTVLYLKALDHVRSFRWRHWLFAREYIIRRTPHPTATGGSPIVTVCFLSPFLPQPSSSIAKLIHIPQWLPNQLSAVMELMVTIYDTYLSPTAPNSVKGESAYDPQVEEMMRQVRDQKDKLAKEVERWCAERGV